MIAYGARSFGVQLAVLIASLQDAEGCLIAAAILILVQTLVIFSSDVVDLRALPTATPVVAN